MIHKIAQLNIKLTGCDDGGCIALAGEHYNLLGVEGPELTAAWVDMLRVGDTLSVTITTDHETIMRLAAETADDERQFLDATPESVANYYFR